MLSRVTVNIIRRSMYNHTRTLCHLRNPLQTDLSCNNSKKPHNVQNYSILYVSKRFKSNKKKVIDIKKDSEDSDEEQEENVEVPVGSKVVNIRLSSIRLDLICKAGFGMSRSKIEEVFYESKLRVNGQKIFKKSKEVEIGDEIDMILHQSFDNPEMLVVNRIVVLSMNPAKEGVQIKLSRDRELLIEDYEDHYLS